MKELKLHLLTHLRKGEPQKVFDLLNNNIEPFSETDKLITPIQAAFNTLGKEKIKGIVSSDEYELRSNKINSSLLEICLLIQKEDLISIETTNLPEKHIAYFLIKRAEKHRKKGDFQNAINDLLEATRQQPNNIPIQNDLALSYRLAGKYLDAFNIFDNIKDKRPNDVICLNEFATCQRELGRYNAALDTLNRGLIIQPGNNHLHTNKFFIYLFFTLNKNEAIAIRDYYENTFEKKLILKTDLQNLYNEFLDHFEGIHNLLASESLIRSYIEECKKKRAFGTAQNLLNKLKYVR